MRGSLSLILMSKLKLIKILLVFTVIFFTSDGTADAAILVIKDNGSLTWNVLASETDSKDRIEKLKIVSLFSGTAADGETQVALKREGDKLTLNVQSVGGDKQVDVTGLSEEIIEVEQTQKAKRLAISHEDDKFLIMQQGTTAQTPYEIIVDAKLKHVSLQTPTGVRFITVLPAEAVESVIKANLIDKVVGDQERIDLTEGASGELEYQMNGSKNINLFNLVDITAPIKISVSATNGEVLSTEKPNWYKILGFLFN
jgi:hypothetical protein